MRVLIVGGVAGGATAAARIRRLDETAEIVMFEKSGYVSYANCGLPYFIGGVIVGEDKLTLSSPAMFKNRYGIDVRVRSEVIDVDPAQKTVTVKNLETGEVYQESYDKLILSPGAKPIRPDLPGIDSPKIHTLRTVEDTLHIRKIVEEEKPQSAVVIGGGFIGLEMAENLLHMGIQTTIIQRSEHLMPPLDADMAHILHTAFRKNGAVLKFGKNTAAFEDTEKGIRILFDDGEKMDADIVILAVGVLPDASLAKQAGLSLGVKGSIAVDDHMRTSDPDIYAVGDAVEIRHFVSGQKAVIALAGPANKEARIAADNICGLDSRYNGSAASSVMKVFDRTVACTGLNEAAAKAAGIDYDKVVLSPMNHASYYPGGRGMIMKVVYEKKTERILGCQIIGMDGVDKRCDVIATAMQAGMKASDLATLDLAYAPPYSSAKDPVNMAGFMIENLEQGMVRQFHWHDLPELLEREDIFLLDTRTAKEFGAGHVDGFYHIPVDELRGRLHELPADKPIYVMCQSGLRSYLSCRILAQKGFDCYNFSGGYSYYKAVVLDEQLAEQSFPCGMES